ncbi:MAG: hypothetical protein Q8P20_00460 [bacterium]|nr:hypothetical protein [bacterium]
MENIFEQIAKNPESLIEDDLDSWIIPGIMEHYDAKLIKLARTAYNDSSGVISPIAIAAFKERSKVEFKIALQTFFFKKEHWRAGRNLKPYLSLCIKRLAHRLYCDRRGDKRINSRVCPACKYDGNKELLVRESGMLKCAVCTKKSIRLFDNLKDLKPEDNERAASIQKQYKFYSLFSTHSAVGIKCAECIRFIPISIIENDSVICPYPDCAHIGKLNTAETMAHPSGAYSRHTVSLNASVGDDSFNSIFQDLLKADSADPDVYIDMATQFNKERDILLEVIEEQMKSIKRTNASSTMMQKLIMYQAYKNMLGKYTEDMISYLAHVKQNADFPIQARIFQEYAKLIENHLPFTIQKCGKSIDIISLTNPDLALFAGISEFEAEVNDYNIIPNNTKEEYIGGRNFKNYGRCFIGKVINITSDGKSIKDKIKEYSFVQIKMDKSILPGTKTLVKHFRILPHYEMHSMVHLQRIRRAIVDSTYFRLHKIKRKPRGSE